jgi:hypothetical protein
MDFERRMQEVACTIGAAFRARVRKKGILAEVPGLARSMRADAAHH